jgi:hypothetical protein
MIRFPVSALAALTMSVTSSAFPHAGAAEPLAEIQIRPIDAPAQLDLAKVVPVFDPATILGDPDLPAAFDANKRMWSVTTRKLSDYSTIFSFRLEDDKRSPLHPSITLDLPYREQSVPIPLSIGTDPPIARVKNYYKFGFDADDSLKAFISSEQVIAALQGDALADEVSISAVLARSLIIYAETVDTLIQGTEWFGRPHSLAQRLEMIKRVRDQAGPNVRRTVDMARLEAAASKLRKAEYHLVTRIWKYSIQGTPHCKDRFPLALALYEHLAKMQRDEYYELVDEAKVTASLSLLAATQCYRKLLTVKGDRKEALPAVIAGPFHNSSALEMAKNLQSKVEQELQTLDAESDETALQEVCKGGDLVPPRDGLCDSLTFLREVQPLLLN